MNLNVHTQLQVRTFECLLRSFQIGQFALTNCFVFARWTVESYPPENRKVIPVTARVKSP